MIDRVTTEIAARLRSARLGAQLTQREVAAEFEIEKNARALLHIFKAELQAPSAQSTPDGSTYLEVLG